MSCLSAQQLKKAYKKRRIIDDVSLHFNAGEVVGLLGPNGAGKTTCFYMIVGLVKPDGGRIHIEGRDITDAPIHIRARHGVGYLPQEASVFRKLTVADNIMSILQLRKDLSRRHMRHKLQELLDEFQLSHLHETKGISLSGGERRRVEIARCLAIDPKFILLDEPFAGVDPISVLEIQKIIRHLQEREIGILITDHNVRETLGICERAYILGGGTLITEGTPEAVLANKQVQEVYLGSDFKL